MTLLLFSRSHQHFEMSNFEQNGVCACYFLIRIIDLIHFYQCDIIKSKFIFGDLDLIFNVTIH